MKEFHRTSNCKSCFQSTHFLIERTDMIHRKTRVRTTLSTAVFIICSICFGLFHRIGTINAQNSMQPPVCSGKVFVSEGTTPCGANIKCDSNACQGGWFTGQTNQNNEPMLFNYCTKDNALPSNNCITYTDAQNSTFCGYHGYCKKMNNVCTALPAGGIATSYFNAASADSPCIVP
jgi:hypothetical protein